MRNSPSFPIIVFFACFAAAALAASCKQEQPAQQTQQYQAIPPQPSPIAPQAYTPPQPVTQPIAVQPIAAQPIAAQPIAAQPIAASPQPAALPAALPAQIPAPAPKQRLEEAAKPPIVENSEAPNVEPGAGAEQAVRKLFSHVNAGRTGAAASMMRDSRSEWKESFEAIEKARVVRTEEWNRNSWATNTAIYKTTVTIKCKPEDPSRPSPFPCGGWNDGSNIRWIELSQSGDVWKVNGLATGP